MISINGRIRLQDQRALSLQEFELARRLASRIQRLVETRGEFIAQHQLDPAIALPGSNWDPNADQPRAGTT
jgi:hypothetical protein